MMLIAWAARLRVIAQFPWYSSTSRSISHWLGVSVVRVKSGEMKNERNLVPRNRMPESPGRRNNLMVLTFGNVCGFSSLFG